MIFGLALRERGWRITYLGPDTPIETIAAAAETLEPDAVVLCALTAGHFETARAPIASLGRAAGACTSAARAPTRTSPAAPVRTCWRATRSTTAAQLSG